MEHSPDNAGFPGQKAGVSSSSDNGMPSTHPVGRSGDTLIGNPWEPATAPGRQDLGEPSAGTPDSGGNGRRRGRIGELGPAWISAIAAVIVALTGAGFFAGRVSAPASSANQPNKISATTVPTAAPVSAGATASPSGAAATAGNGTLLGSYGFQLTNGYNAPLGPTAPTQSQIAAGGAYDVGYNGDLYAGSNEKMISLPAGTTPTYSACTTGTVFEDNASPAQGTSFCIIETSGRVAGVTVTSMGSSQSYATLQVTVWKYVP